MSSMSVYGDAKKASERHDMIQKLAMELVN